MPIAQYADRCNRRNLIAAAVALWSGMTVISGFAMNVLHLMLARIGVGIGEAGCSPPAHSMIADYYPPEKRSTAMGFYTIGISAGIMLAYLGGGWIVENMGWRTAFIAVGRAGFAAGADRSLHAARTGTRRVRGQDGRRPAAGPRRSCALPEPALLISAHGRLPQGFRPSSVIRPSAFLPSFMDRSFGVGMLEVGRWLGLILGIAGGAGFFFGGYISDRLGRSGQRRSLLFISVPPCWYPRACCRRCFLAGSWRLSLLLFVLPAATMNVYLAPVLALTQSLVSLRMRATASALVLLIINVIGLACGTLDHGRAERFAETAFRRRVHPLQPADRDGRDIAVGGFFTITGRAAGPIDGDLARAMEGD